MADVPPLTRQEQETPDTCEAIAVESGLYLDMELLPSDIQLVSNHTNLHPRTAYEDFEDPAGPVPVAPMVVAVTAKRVALLAC